jgi:bifunctional enzyme CysN/CysC
MATSFDVEAYLETYAHTELIRFITCGSVDDGKSTLIGRLLYEAKSLFEDQLDALRKESERFGTQSGEIDFALLVDGLSAEREQGITIDVAYRFFQTDKRKFIVADTPGHEQYTRNMVTGASTADAAVILVDARQGILPQTRRHAYIAALLGIRHVIVAINKMDLVEYSEHTFERIRLEMLALASRLQLHEMTAIPVSALRGDNIVERSAKTPWYTGSTLLGLLETIPVRVALSQRPFRMPIQWVNRPHADFRGVSGTVISGHISTGDSIKVLPSGQVAHIAEIVTLDGSLNTAYTDQAPTLIFDRALDASRGDVICAAQSPCERADQFSAQLVWMNEEVGYQGRSYFLKIGTLTVSASLTAIRYVVDINSYQERPATLLNLNDIANIHLSTDRDIPFEPYRECPMMGAFILIDKVTHATLAAGMINHSLRRSKNIHYHTHAIDAEARQALNGHSGQVVWFTGLSGSGKSTVADQLERALYTRGVRTYLLDGDNIRHGLNKDLGFTDADRIENIRRIAEVAKLMADAGLVVITSFISPFRAERRYARGLFQEGAFTEVYMNTPLEVAEARDPKGLYKKARAGLIPNFTGIGSAYEPPESAEVVLDGGAGLSVDELTAQVMSALTID